MNQFKNGTVFVVVATFVTVVLLLLTDRNDKDLSKSVVDKPEAVDKLVAEEEINKQEVEVLAKPMLDKKDKVLNTEKLPVEVLEGLFPEKIAKTEQNEAEDEIVKQEVTESEIVGTGNLDQPIWTQTLGEFVSLKDNNMVINVMPTNTNGLQGDKPSEVVTTKSDRFNANIPADYNYQEMPMYNGGYYVAPMPSYLMSSALPKSSVSEK